MSHGIRLIVAITALVFASSFVAESQGYVSLIESSDFNRVLHPLLTGSNAGVANADHVATKTTTTMAQSVAVEHPPVPSSIPVHSPDRADTAEKGLSDDAADESPSVRELPHKLQAFFDRVDAAQRSVGPPVHVVQLGDSEVASDAVTMTARDLAAAKYGDGGPGFVLAMKPWPSYSRSKILHSKPEKFRVRSFPRREIKDGHYGPGGVGFEPKGGYSRFMSLRSDIVGKPCVVTFHYLQQPKGGKVSLVAGRNVVAEVSTEGAKLANQHPVDLAACPKSLGFRMMGGGRLRVFGWQIHTKLGGMSWTSIGVNGARYSHLNNYADGAFAKSLGAIKPDLLIFGFGLNVTSYPHGLNKNYESRMQHVFEGLKPLIAKIPCVILGPYPVAAKLKGRWAVSPTLYKVLEIQKRQADRHGCVFVDRFTRLGGADVLSKWRRGRPRILSADNVHLTREGSRQMGEFIFKYLTVEYEKSAARSDK
ncbi:MAG: hypothetical protein CMH52_03430 [Myxococcales bacterium]|nr:hypothetical protein [Myxococcales bacterium]